MIAVCSEIKTEQVNELCGQKAKFVNVKDNGIYIDQWVLRDKS